MELRFRGGNMGVRAQTAITKPLDTTGKPEKLFEQAVKTEKLAVVTLAKKLKS